MIIEKELENKTIEKPLNKPFSAVNLPSKDKNELRTLIIEKKLKELLQYDKSQQIPLFLSIKEGFFHSICKKIVSHDYKYIAIGISGESASGKTTFVMNSINSLSANQEGVITILYCDDYYKDTAKEFQEAGSFEALFKMGFNFDVPNAIDLEKIKIHLEQIKSGKSIVCPKYNFATCESIEYGEVKKPASVIFTEGLFALNPILRNTYDIGIYVDSPHDVIKDRWFKRAAFRGKTEQDAKMQFEIVNREAQNHIRPLKNNADIVINGLADAEYIQYMIQELFKILSE